MLLVLKPWKDGLGCLSTPQRMLDPLRAGQPMEQLCQSIPGQWDGTQRLLACLQTLGSSLELASDSDLPLDPLLVLGDSVDGCHREILLRAEWDGCLRCAGWGWENRCRGAVMPTPFLKSSLLNEFDAFSGHQCLITPRSRGGAPGVRGGRCGRRTAHGDFTGSPTTSLYFSLLLSFLLHFRPLVAGLID